MPRRQDITSSRLLNAVSEKLREVLESVLPQPEPEPDPIPARVQDRR